MTETLLVNENLIDKSSQSQRDTLTVETEFKVLMTTEEGEKIKADIELLKDMGYNKTMINKIYILLHPENIERAIDYMTEINGIYQHNFFENHISTKDKNLCFICKKAKQYNLDYIPDYLLDNNINNQNNNSNNEFIEQDSLDFSYEVKKILQKKKKMLVMNAMYALRKLEKMKKILMLSHVGIFVVHNVG